MKKLISEITIIIVFLSLITCAFAQKDFSHRFKAMRVPSGKIITIPLEADHSTGFSWQLTKISDKTVIEFVKKEYTGKKEGPGAIERWSFKTLKKGKAALIFEFKRPGEKDIPAQRSEEFTVFIE